MLNFNRANSLTATVKSLPYLVVVAALFPIAACAADAPVPPPDTLSASEILDRSAATYRSLRSYADEGTVVTSVEGSPSPLKSLEFQTRFAQGGRLRFAYHDVAYGGMTTRYALLIENGRATVKSSLSGEDGNTKDAVDAVAEVTGVSDGAAYTIPAVLLPAVAWKRETWLSAPKAQRIDDGIERGIHCYRVERRSPIDSHRALSAVDAAYGVVTVYWIAMDSALLLRTDRDVHLDGRRLNIETQYTPAANTEIQAGAFGLAWY